MGCTVSCPLEQTLESTKQGKFTGEARVWRREWMLRAKERFMTG